MATTYQTQYRDQYIRGFEQKLSKFRATGVNEYVISGNQVTFLVADTGGRSAVTRGQNGLIPSAADNLNQVTAPMVEWHDKPRRTKFDIFTNQGDGRRILQEGSIKVLNRKVDDLMIEELSNATHTTGSAETMSLALVAKAVAILGLEDVDLEDEEDMFFAISPAAHAYMMQIPEFTSAEYVDVKPFPGAISPVKMRRWYGINWFISNRLEGRATASETLLLWHRNSIGWAVNTGDMEVVAGYDEQDSYYWARASAFMGVKLLQNDGVVKVIHNGAAYVAS